jgi:nucleotide-binding universal stress UspA family protein
VLHVTPLLPRADAFPPTFDPVTLAPITTSEWQAQLSAFAGPALGRDRTARFLVRRGDAAAQILEAADDADLVVLGTHGRRGFERWILGSVAERVLHKARCPVVTTRGEGQDAMRIGRILCAVDFSKAASSAAACAQWFASRLGARVTFLHVLDWKSTEIPPQLSGIRALYEDFLKTHALGLLKTIPGPIGLGRNEIVAFGRPAEVIARMARGFDLVVLGVHGRSRLDLALFGSTANRVVQGSPCPVMTVRSFAAHFGGSASASASRVARAARGRQ